VEFEGFDGTGGNGDNGVTAILRALAEVIFERAA
jgi:hypothetical protein